MHASLGHTFTDKISGFRGVAIGRVEYLTGCNQLLLQAKSGDQNKRVDAEWFDEQRLVCDDTVERVVIDNGTNPGFDRQAPKR